MNEVLYTYFLSQLVNFETPKLRRLVEKAGGVENFFDMEAKDLGSLGEPISVNESELFETLHDREVLERSYDGLISQNVRYVSENDEDYPWRLLEIEDRPFGLFVKGKLPDPEKKSVAIIGSRRASSYGREMAEFFASKMAQAGINVISGMALGIDGYAGRAALCREQSSFAVLGGGVDTCYPMENIGLYKSLSEHGGIISEKPCGYFGRPYDFPIRNRIISGLSDCVLVIEGAENSGTLITANRAIEQDRAVFALPGRVNERMARGCNNLIRDGAHILLCPEDVFCYLGLPAAGETFKKPHVRMTEMEKCVFELIGQEEKTVDALLTLSNLPISVLLETLLRLEVLGMVKKGPMGGYKTVY